MQLKDKLASTALARFGRRSAATAVASVALMTGGVVASASPASATDICPSGQLCLYRSTHFRTMEFQTGKTYECFQLARYGLADNPYQVWSYDNNLPVKAEFWRSNPVVGGGRPDWLPVNSIAAGSSSTNTGGALDRAVLVCTGGRSPYWA